MSHRLVKKVKRVGPYLLQRTLGMGASGKVKLAITQDTEIPVAIKIISKSTLDAKSVSRIAREVHILRNLNSHPFVVQLFDVLETSKDIYFVMEFVQGQELFDHIIVRKRLPDVEAKRIFGQIVLAVSFCHSLGIIHRDLKPENLLLDEHLDIRLIDFGLSYFSDNVEDIMKTRCGSPSYTAPEVLCNDGYDKSADVFSLGIILYAILAGSLPFAGERHEEIVRQMLMEDYTIPFFIGPEPASLIRKMLRADPKKRITIQQLKNSKWLDLSNAKYPFGFSYDGLVQLEKRRSIKRGSSGELVALGPDRVLEFRKRSEGLFAEHRDSTLSLVTTSETSFSDQRGSTGLEDFSKLPVIPEDEEVDGRHLTTSGTMTVGDSDSFKPNGKKISIIGEYVREANEKEAAAGKPSIRISVASCDNFALEKMIEEVDEEERLAIDNALAPADMHVIDRGLSPQTSDGESTGSAHSQHSGDEASKDRKVTRRKRGGSRGVLSWLHRKVVGWSKKGANESGTRLRKNSDAGDYRNGTPSSSTSKLGEAFNALSASDGIENEEISRPVSNGKKPAETPGDPMTDLSPAAESEKNLPREKPNHIAFSHQTISFMQPEKIMTEIKRVLDKLDIKYEEDDQFRLKCRTRATPSTSTLMFTLEVAALPNLKKTYVVVYLRDPMQKAMWHLHSELCEKVVNELEL